MPYTSCAVSFGLYDVSAAQDASYASINAQSFVDFNAFNAEGGLAAPKAGTLEENFFWLDGTYSLFLDDAGGLNYIYWSRTMSGQSGAFSTPPTITVQFTQNHSSVGLTLRFYEPTDDYPDDVTIRWYDGYGSPITSERYYPDSPVFTADAMIENYRRIEIAFHHTSKPYRYVKMLEIGFGLVKAFGEDEIISASILEELDPISAELPYNVLTLRVYSLHSQLSPLNPQGIFSFLQQKQPLEVTEIVGGQSIFMGTFYLDEWPDSTDDSLTMRAIDLVGVIGLTSFYGGMYTNYPAPRLVDDIMRSAGADYELSNGFSAASVSGYLPIMSCREAIQQVAIAIGAVVDSSRGAAIRIQPPPQNSSLRISKSRKIVGGKMRLRPMVTGISVTAHSYVETREQQELLNETLAPGDHEVVFREPVYDLSITGGQIIESNVNRALVRVPSRGAVTLSGYRYADSQKIIMRSPPLPAGAAVNVLEIKDATLIGESNAMDVANRVYDYYQRRYENEFRLVTETEKAGDYVVVDSLRGESLRGVAESMNIDLTGGFLSNVRVVGSRVETHEGGYYTGELYAGEEVGVI